MRSIASIYKDRDLADVLREIYISGMQVYVFLENSDNPLNLFCSAFLPVPRRIIWELGHAIECADDVEVRLRMAHSTDTIEFESHRQFDSLKSIKEKDEQKFLSDNLLQSLLLQSPDGCYLIKVGKVLPEVDPGLPEKSYTQCKSEVLKHYFVDPPRKMGDLYITTTIPVSAKKLFVAGNLPGLLLRYAIRLSSTLEQEDPDWRNWSSGKKRIEKLVEELFPDLTKPEWKRLVVAAASQGELRTSGEAEDHSKENLATNA